MHITRPCLRRREAAPPAHSPPSTTRSLLLLLHYPLILIWFEGEAVHDCKVIPGRVDFNHSLRTPAFGVLPLATLRPLSRRFSPQLSFITPRLQLGSPWVTKMEEIFWQYHATRVEIRESTNMSVRARRSPHTTCVCVGMWVGVGLGSLLFCLGCGATYLPYILIIENHTINMLPAYSFSPGSPSSFSFGRTSMMMRPDQLTFGRPRRHLSPRKSGGNVPPRPDFHQEAPKIRL